MNNIVLAVVLLGGCLLMHLFMMRKDGHGDSHGHDAADTDKEGKNDKTHSGHGCH